MGTHLNKSAWSFSVAVIVVALLLRFADLEPAGQAIAEEATPARGGEVASCCVRHHGGNCCSGGDGECCYGTEAAMLNRLSRPQPRLELVAFVMQDKQPDPPEKQATPEAKALGDEINKALLNHQRALKDAYVCCIMPGCVFCQTAGDSCPCGTNLRKGEPVCPECWGGWQAGQGSIPAVRKDDVKIFPKQTLKTMYEARAKKFGQALGSSPPEKK